MEDDELYTVWAGLKALTIRECVGEKTDDKDTRLHPSHHGDSGQVSEVFKQSVVIPKSVRRQEDTMCNFATTSTHFWRCSN